MTSVEEVPHGGPDNGKCPSCGEPVKGTWKVCPLCETALVRSACPSCGIAVKDNWKICPECSARLICPSCGRRLPDGPSACPECGQGRQDSPQSRTVLVEPVTGMEMVLVPAGKFLMGDLFDIGWDNEVPVLEVRVDAFYLGKYLVTQEQWEKVMRENPSMFRQGGRYPVEQVTWDDVNEFLRRLDRLTVRDQPLRLPSETEWEYAARSGGRKELYAGGDDIDRVAWYAENSKGSTHPAGLRAPNGLGLYDVSGNFWDWCQDIYMPNAVSATDWDRIPQKGATRERVIRGGSWNLDDWSARCSRRFGFVEDYFGAGLGFRLAQTARV